MSLSKLKAVLKSKDVVYGTDKTLKNLKLGKTKTVFLAKNCHKDTKEKIMCYDVEVIEIDMDSNELALVCKRPHFITVLSN